MDDVKPPRFSVATDTLTPEDLDVVRVRGSEAISKPSSFDVDVLVRANVDTVPSLLGKRARLTFYPSSERRIGGIVIRIEAHPPVDDLPMYRLRLVPALWLLRQRKTSRIFQHMGVPEIVRAVLADAGIEQRWNLERDYPTREYCVQYQETDLRFITRLLAEEGIFYQIADPADSTPTAPETVVFGDAISGYRPIGGDTELPFRTTGSLEGSEQVTTFALKHQVRSEAVLLRAHDFKRPRFDMRGEARVAGRAAEPAPLGIYDHDRDPEEGRVEPGAAAASLEQSRRRAAMAAGASTCQRLAPGAWFRLVDHPRDELSRGYVVVSVDHDIHQVGGRRLHATGAETYTNRFQCVPRNVLFRPKPARRTLHQVTETALVVGPPGEEIHVDKHGRIKVQFYWDLEGRNDDHSSCWLRVAQPWAGAAWGSQFIPRVGMEVLVTFVGGDIDRPLVVGAVYNTLNPTPYALPAHKTQSGIKTRSTPGGGGANELRFEDAASNEQIYLHAQRNLDEVVENNHTRTIRGDEAISVGRNSAVEIQGDQDTTVHGNEVITINKNLVLHVVGKQIIRVDGQSSGDGGESSAAAPSDDPMAPAPTDDGTTASTAARELFEQELLNQQNASDKLLFLREQVPEAFYPRARQLSEAVEAAQERVTRLQESALSAPDPQARKALATQASTVRTSIGQAITDALEPAPPAVQRLQIAVIEHLQELWHRAERIERSLSDSADAQGEAALEGGSGMARGGGGATVKPWTKTKKGENSLLQISNGGGTINSPDGDLTLIGGGGGMVKITGGNIHLIAPGDIAIHAAGTLSLMGKTISSVSTGDTTLQANGDLTATASTIFLNP